MSTYYLFSYYLFIDSSAAPAWAVCRERGMVSGVVLVAFALLFLNWEVGGVKKNNGRQIQFCYPLFAEEIIW